MRWLTTGVCMGGLLAVALGVPAAPAASAQEKKGKAQVTGSVKVGDPAPKFSGVDDQGKPYQSSDVVGKKTVVIFFFPAALTGG